MRGSHCIITAISTITICALLGGQAVSAETAGVKHLTKVKISANDSAVVFAFAADGPISKKDIELFRDRKEKMVFSIRVKRAVVRKKRWPRSPGAPIKATALFGSTYKKNSSVLRVRMYAPVSLSMLNQAVAQPQADGTIVVHVPRTAAIALAWKGGQKIDAAPKIVAVAAAPKVVAAAPKTVVAPAVVVPTQPAKPALAAAPVSPTPAVEAAPKVEAATSAATTVGGAVETAAQTTKSTLAGPVDSPKIDELLLPELGADAPSETVPAARDIEGPSAGMIAISGLFLLFVGVVLWRKAKAQRGDGAEGPLMRPLGTHILGPKQRLLLMDIAGEMVLLGTSDKGVQMLTKISGPAAAQWQAQTQPLAAPQANPQSSSSRAPAATQQATGAALLNQAPNWLNAMNAAVERGDDEPAEADREIPEAAGALSARLGRAFAKVRTVAMRPQTVASEQVEQSFFDREREALREAAEDDALAALCDAVEDEQPTPRASWRRPEAVEAQASRQQPRPQGEAMPDLLSKIRRLQSA